MINIDNNRHTEITKKIIQAFNKVHSIFDFGFPKIIYEDALLVELSKMSLAVEKQISVYLEGNETESFLADFIIENSIIIELKTEETLCKEHEFHLAKFINATDIQVAVLLNFGKKPEFKSKVFSNNKMLI